LAAAATGRKRPADSIENDFASAATGPSTIGYLHKKFKRLAEVGDGDHGNQDENCDDKDGGVGICGKKSRASVVSSSDKSPDAGPTIIVRSPRGRSRDPMTSCPLR
jgi:hypothetical protein